MNLREIFFLFWANFVTISHVPLQLAVSSHENATPVKLINNSAGHLNGPARTIGAAVIGYLGKTPMRPQVAARVPGDRAGGWVVFCALKSS